GGMAAIVLGKMLNVDYTIAFSPMLRNYKESVSKQEINEKLQTKEFIEFVSFANSDIPIFYVFPSGSEWDIYNSNLVKDFKNVYFLPIKSSVHGVPINKRVLSKFLSCNKEDLKKYCKYKNTDIISEYKFVKDNWGIKFYFLRIWDYIKKYPFFIFRKDFYNNIFSCF
ncbi:hypothetical protein IJG14_02980, partial [bacterium]|nr:hypothetical protein [bacterium]